MMTTMKKKLDAGEYATAEKFRDDFKLMIKNCFTFNPAGNPVHEAGKLLQQLFDEKWKNLPTPRPYDDSDEDDDEDADVRNFMEAHMDDLEEEKDSDWSDNEQGGDEEEEDEGEVPEEAG